MANIAIHLRDTQTGLTCVVYDSGELDGLEYLWIDGGNFACDCNRALILDKALTQEGTPRRVGEVPCGDTRIVIDKMIDQETGKALFENC